MVKKVESETKYMKPDMIIGHQEIIVLLKAAVKKDRISPAYIFTGPAAIGKKKIAMYFAKMLNCINRLEEPCGQCVSCVKIEASRSPDVILVTPAGKSNSIKIDNIREVKHEAALMPFEARYKFFIIDDADTMTQEASNSLLKVLEEVKTNSVFILITHSVSKILPTIMSRCAHIKFKSGSVQDIAEAMVKFYASSREEADFIAKFSDRCIGRAIMIKDADIADKKNKVINKVMRYMAALNPHMVFGEWKYSDRTVLKEDITYMLTWFRDIWLVKMMGDGSLIYNSDRLDTIMKVVEDISLERLEMIINVLVTLSSYIDANVNTKLIVDKLLCELSELKKGSEIYA